jgi:SAM-dependent methyltransferase
MHESVLEWVDKQLETVDCTGLVLDVGSLNVNGSAKSTVMRHGDPLQYIGVDMRPGIGVDTVAYAEDLVEVFGRAKFQLVVCCEMLEHAETWQRALWGVKQQVAPGGTLLLTTRGPGFALHDFPEDHWRFTTDLLEKACSDMGDVRAYEDPQMPGVFVRATGPAPKCLSTEDVDRHLKALPVKPLDTAD